MKSLTTVLLFLLMNVMFSNKIKDKITSQTISTVPENMFRVSRTVACSKAALLRQIRAEIEEDREELLANGRRKKKGKFYWVKEWGYGPAAYLFDFLDPIYVESVTKEMNMMFKSLKAFPRLDKDYKDPFDFKKLISLDSTLLNRKLLKQLKLFTKNYDPEVYNLSLNTVQVRKAMINWKWTGEKSNPNFAKKFVSRFDMNFDGRLNPRELVLGSIMNNRGIMGTQLCQQCFNNSTKSIDQVFLYLDCNDDGWLSAEEFWNNMNNLNRNTDKNNIFSFGVEDSIRTASINDFIIKNGKIKEGFITKEEFRQGLLLGFWDRQTEKTKILFDDSRTLKSHRWRDDDTVDISLYNYYKKKLDAEMPKD